MHVLDDVDWKNCTEEQKAMFSQALRNVFDRLPHEVQASIQAFWMGGRFMVTTRNLLTTPVVCGKPGIKCLQCDAGHTIEFDPELFTNMPTEIQEGAIAHELAHVFQHARGQIWGLHERREIEKEADALVVLWDFTDPRPWMDKNAHRVW